MPAVGRWGLKSNIYAPFLYTLLCYPPIYLKVPQMATPFGFSGLKYRISHFLPAFYVFALLILCHLFFFISFHCAPTVQK